MSHTHFLSRCVQSFSSGKYFRVAGCSLANWRKSSIVRPSIYGTAATLTVYLLTYCNVKCKYSYLFVSIRNLLQEEDVDTVHLRQVSLAILEQEVVELFLALELFHDFMDIDLL
jgi:hypothetical protein